MPMNRDTVPRTTKRLRLPNEPAQGGWYTDDEWAELRRACEDSADWRTGWKPTEFVERFEGAFATHTTAQYAVAFNSGGTAMEMVLHALQLEPADAVVSCAINFVGPHLAVIHAGAQLVLAEPEEGALNLDVADVERAVSEHPRVRVILITHWNGAVCDLRPFLDVARAHPHPVHGPPVVIVDAARACGGISPAGLPVGGEGFATVFSFESKKLITTLGQGGMVTTSDPSLAEQLRLLRTYGGRSRWGTNQLMTKAQAAVGFIQLERLGDMLDARIQRAHQRSTAVADIPELTGPPVLHGRQHVYYRHNLLVPQSWGRKGRDALMDTLAGDFGIGSIVSDPPTWHHGLIGAHTMGQRCPRAEALAGRLLCPCLHPLMTDDEERDVQLALKLAVGRTARALDLPRTETHHD
ncbi:aminotransferase class I/II-fold pyridoxal phosphate-dependent enzyme [Streptomyces sp. NPDC058254]|uniref:aminotransferase class I/II-fold pyridoxal phosphate-dependent enzyme n=1 Tax=Streptomyces sp. NPDC058254 TaxID=3346406 RepID=UPI0036E2E9BC